MRRGSHTARSRVAGSLVALACVAVAALGYASPAAATARIQPAAPAQRGEAADVLDYWTPGRMSSTQPLDAPSGFADIASASFAPIAEPSVPPFSVNGRLFVRQGRQRGFCSATAINSPTRRVVLTAAHCLNSGPRGLRGTTAWSNYLEFVPAYTNGVAPFGAFVARRNSVFVLRQWVKFGNPNFDVGAIVTSPNAEGAFVADAVGGGATIAIDRSRRQDFQTFGYPGKRRWLQGCTSPYVGDDSSTYRIPGPPTMAIGCHWAPGASGGGWLTDEGTTINGLTSYAQRGDKLHTFGPYFSKVNVGRLVADL